MTPLEAFLLGMVTMSSLIAGAFFLKFWRASRDILFLAFAAFFLVDGAERIGLIAFVSRANEGSAWFYIVRVLALMGIVVAIWGKNYRRRE